jgi:hypothetical protein
VVFCGKDRRKVLVAPLDSRLQGLILEKRLAAGHGALDSRHLPFLTDLADGWLLPQLC